jgi:hypothetical protein
LAQWSSYPPGKKKIGFESRHDVRFIRESILMLFSALNFVIYVEK